MRRRTFIAGLGSAAVWPVLGRAQQADRLLRIGFLGAASLSGYTNQLAGFRQGLRDLNYVEGANIIIEYRWAEGNYARLPELAAELVRSDVAVIVTHGTPGSLAAKRATTTIPIVIATVGNPVATGIVDSFARPGGNITGQSAFNPELGAKKIGLLREIVPQINRVAYLINPDNPGSTGATLSTLESAAQHLNLELQQFSARGPNEFESAFARMEQGRIQAVEVDDDAVFAANIEAVAVLAAKRRLLSIGSTSFARAGGLIGYGADNFATFRRAAAFVDKILKGTKPADLPIEQATKFQFIVNLKTAKALGLTIPETLLATADEVIQ